MTRKIYVPVKFLSFLEEINLIIYFDTHNLINKIKFDFMPINRLSQQIEPPSYIQQAISNYFSGISKDLALPHNLITKSSFQLKVLQALKKIPYGMKKTYGKLASELNTHPRAIGQALKSNPLPLIYPCHRIVSKTSIGGFIGQSKGNNINLKHALLELEKSVIKR